MTSQVASLIADTCLCLLMQLSAALNSYSIATRIEDLRWLAVASRCPPLKGIGFIIYLLGSGSVYHKLELS